MFISYFYVPADKPPRLEHLPSLLPQWKGVPTVEMDVSADNLFSLLDLLQNSDLEGFLVVLPEPEDVWDTAVVDHRYVFKHSRES